MFPICRIQINQDKDNNTLYDNNSSDKLSFYSIQKIISNSNLDVDDSLNELIKAIKD